MHLYHGHAVKKIISISPGGSFLLQLLFHPSHISRIGPSNSIICISFPTYTRFSKYSASLSSSHSSSRCCSPSSLHRLSSLRLPLRHPSLLLIGLAQYQQTQPLASQSVKLDISRHRRTAVLAPPVPSPAAPTTSHVPLATVTCIATILLFKTAAVLMALAVSSSVDV